MIFDKFQTSQTNHYSQMSKAVVITKKNEKDLKRAIAKAIEAEEDVDEAIDAWISELKPAPKGKGSRAKKPVDEATKKMEAEIGKKPKRGKSAYICFGEANRARIKEENPDANFGEITRLLADEWNAIKDDKKKSKKYHDAATKDAERAKKELASYEKKKKAYKVEDDAEEGEDEEKSSEEAPPKKGAKGKAAKKPAPKGKGKGKPAKEESEEEESEDTKKPAPKGKGKAAPKKGAKGKPAEEDASSGDEEEGDDNKAAVDYSKMKLPELKKLAKERNVDIKGKTKKDDIVAALEEALGEEKEEEEEVEEKEEEEEVEEEDEE